MKHEEYLSQQTLPQHLTWEEINNPDQVIAEFFNYYSLQNSRAKLKHWFHAALEDDVMLASGDLGNLFSFYQQLERLVEAVWLSRTEEITTSSVDKGEY